MRGLRGLDRGARLTALLALSLVAVWITSPAAAARPPRPVLVGDDATGDWGSEVNPGLGPAGAELGQDLARAWIAAPRPGRLVFTIETKGLPPAGVASVPTGYQWEFLVDTSFFRIQTCDADVVASCPEAPAGSVAPFLLWECDIALFTGCELAGSGRAELDPGKSTISYGVPARSVEARPGSVIGAAATQGPSIKAYAAASVPQLYASTPHDDMETPGTFTVRA